MNKISLLVLAAFLNVGALDLASAAPFVNCREVLLGDEVQNTQFYFQGTVRDDIMTANAVRVFVSPRSKIGPLRSVSSPSSSAARVNPVADPIYLITRITTVADGVTFQLAGGGELSLGKGPSTRSSLVTVAFVRPNGPELARIFRTCEILKPEIGSTVSN